MASASSEFEYFRDSASAASTLSTDGETQTAMDNFPDWRVPIELGQSEEYTNARQELYDSEKAYLGYLCMLQRLFLNPMRKMTKVVHRSDVKTLFGDLTSILMTNKEFLMSLRAKPSVCEAFRTIAPFLKLYTSYAGNYQNALKVYSRLMAKPEFRSFIEKQEANPRLLGIKFPALLIMPIQRVPRYILLLQRLRATTNRQREKSDLRRLIGEMEELTFLIDSCIAEFENGKNLWKIQESLGLKEGIVAPGRRLIKDGALFKRNLCGEPTYHERFFWLFNDILVYGKRRLGMGPKYECSCIFQLRHVQMTYIQLEGAIQLKCKNYSLSLTSDTYESIASWNEEMGEAIERVKMLRKTLRKESSLQPVKEFKSKIRKRISKKIMNTTTMYKMTASAKREAMLIKKRQEKSSSTPPQAMTPGRFTAGHQGSPMFTQTPATSSETPRKRPAPPTPKSEFDIELEAVIRKRRFNIEKLDQTETPPLQQIRTPKSTKKFAASPVPVGKTPDRPLLLDQSFGSRRYYDKKEFENKENVVYRDEPKTEDRPVLSTLQIRKYSYMEHNTPDRCKSQFAESSSSINSDDSKPVIQNLRPATKKVPWWVTEGVPAEYRKSQERSGILNSCTLL